MPSIALSKLLKELRESYGLTQKDMERNGICTQSQLSKIESGDTTPGLHILHRLAECYGVTMDYFSHALDTEDPHYEITRLNFVRETLREIRRDVRKQEYHPVKLMLKEVEHHSLFQAPPVKQFILWHKGIVEHEIHKDDEKALADLNRALKLIPNQRMSAQQAEIMNSMGIIHLNGKDYQTASQFFLDALRMSQSLFQSHHHEIKTRLLYNLAIAYHKREQFHLASNSCLQAIQHCLTHESFYLLGELYYQHGLSLYHLNQIEPARESMNESISLLTRLGQTKHLPYILDKRKELKLG